MLSADASAFKSDSPDLEVFSFADIRAATNDFAPENMLGEAIIDGKNQPNKWLLLAKVMVPVASVALLLGLTLCYFRKRLHNYMTDASAFKSDSPDLEVFSFADIRAATNDFAPENMLGEGGFGPVYKGKLRDGQEVAVKRLSKTSSQGFEELKTEISDFGLARMFHKSEHEANTDRIVGTYGYVPPEYVKQGLYSTKYDVYSFGVLLLQIISGKRNNCLYGINENLNLLEYAYELWKDDRGMEFIDPALDDSSSRFKLMRCLQIALLCVQEKQEDRPSMLQVSTMLTNETEPMMIPKRPAFSMKTDEDASFKLNMSSINDPVISEIEPR
ncbi:hypothetical protein Nepgr_006315 [Nepenthes gracilis]|uniref:Protein kinase domain-containing protein n=1 Tax=Nepenthes gracilis TaxID=150966 RepID=A0AAD3S561_NEPGR|nr:hypothetical protein Nepgr_006315 [Nepenthes gracilis]